MASNNKNGRVKKIRRKYGERAFERWGARGGSPILLSHKYKRPVKGYKVTRT